MPNWLLIFIKVVTIIPVVVEGIASLVKKAKDDYSK